MTLTKYNAAGEKMINEAGFAPQAVVFSAYQAGAQSLSAATWTKLAINSKEFDPFNFYDTVNFRFQPKVPGYYDISGAWENNAAVVAGHQPVCSIWKNGAEYKRGGMGAYPGSGANQVLSVNALVYLNGTTDYVELYGYSQDAVGVYTGSNFTFFTGALVASSVGVAPEPWHYVGNPGEPAFQNSWVNYDVQARGARFFKDPHGMVHLSGLIKNGTQGGAIFTIPAGYRIGGTGQHFTMASGNGPVQSHVNPDGTIDSFQGSSAQPPWTNAWVDLSAIHYRAEQ